MNGIRDVFSHRQRRERRAFLAAVVCLGGYVGVAEGLSIPAAPTAAYLPAVTAQATELLEGEDLAPEVEASNAFDEEIPLVWDEGPSAGGCRARNRCRVQRRVPVATPELADRALELGLGTRAAARRVLSQRPSPELRELAGAVTDETLTWPVDGGRFGRGFGFVRRERREIPHLGVDITAPAGTPIYAAQDGIVVYSDDGLAGYGNVVVMAHGDGSTTLYAHCKETYVVAGQRVPRGRTIGAVGETGIARGAHLHFELRHGGRPTSPMPFFSRPPI